jgi:hypothetical protein
VQNKGTIVLTVAAVAIGVAAMLYVLAFYPFRSKMAAKVSFGYTTNDPALGPIAVINVTNESGENITCELCPPQMMKHGVWSKLVYPKGPAGLIRSISLSLSAHQAGTFNSPVPTNCEAWQVPVWWYYDKASQFELVRGCIEGNIYWNSQRLLNGQSPHFYNSSMGGSYNAFSETITNK